jgi:ABC-type branched-subunit amino acid transport system permease subunit
MNQDGEHLRLLAIFHYIVAGLAALFSFLPLLYTAMGAFFVVAAHHPAAKPGQEPPPEMIGWFFIAFGTAFFLLGLIMAILILMAGRSLAQRRRYWFAFVVACIECFFMPFGTALGVFTIIVLSRESVKKLFGVDGAMESSGN